jgi:predicted house-cleaning noncanonical NTP pyrophosphatase (MazG superfamily)
MPYDNSDDPDGQRVKVSQETIKQAKRLFGKKPAKNADMILEYPLDDRIMRRCNNEMEANRHKGNSWMDAQQTPLPYLKNKLQEEYAEFVLAPISEPEMIEKEGADLINVISMIMRRYRRA